MKKLSVFILFYCTAIILIYFIFFPGLTGGFILDDKPNITQNFALHITNPTLNDFLYAAYSFEPGGSSRPLSMLSFALDFLRAGLNPFAFKTTNLVIHSITFVALMFFFRKLIKLSNLSKYYTVTALALALFWAIHPMQVSSVLYIVQRMQTLGTMLLVFALLTYVHMRQLQIKGLNSRHYGFLTVLLWFLAFSCKEDSAMLPAYTLILELTILRFAAQDTRTTERLRWIYTSSIFMGTIVFFFVVVPHYWSWQAYSGRDFSTLERLLTQGRVLNMYLWQILLPYPESMKFFYDEFTVSRSIWQPLSTLPAWFLNASLLLWAWTWRKARPLLSCGILLFFAGHFMTSNIIPLELSFEHRNHFPLIGVALALCDLFIVVIQRLKFSNLSAGFIVILVLVLLSTSTLYRSYIWGDNLRLAQHNLKAAPNSERAWAFLCATYFDRSKDRPENLDMAIKTCIEGAEKLPNSAILSNNIVIYKTQKGTVTQEDWDLFLERLQSAQMNIQNKGILWVTLSNAERGKYDNEPAVLKTIEIITSKTTLRPSEYLRVAAYIFNQTHEPIKSFSYMQRAVELSPPDDPAIKKMLHELYVAGREDWRAQLIQLQYENKIKVNIQ